MTSMHGLKAEPLPGVSLPPSRELDFPSVLLITFVTLKIREPKMHTRDGADFSSGEDA